MELLCVCVCVCVYLISQIIQRTPVAFNVGDLQSKL